MALKLGNACEFYLWTGTIRYINLDVTMGLPAKLWKGKSQAIRNRCQWVSLTMPNCPLCSVTINSINENMYKVHSGIKNYVIDAELNDCRRSLIKSAHNYNMLQGFLRILASWHLLNKVVQKRRQHGWSEKVNSFFNWLERFTKDQIPGKLN